MDLWCKVQDVLSGKHLKKHRNDKHEFAFSGLLRCGHCGCALVGEIKKKRYIYYHCTHFKRHCPEPYVREEVLEDEFNAVLRGLHFPAINIETVQLRQPFDLIADMAAIPALKAPDSGAFQAESSLRRGRRDSNPRRPT
jgi:hypothetical protein